MEVQKGISNSDFDKALKIGRPPNIVELFPKFPRPDCEREGN